MSKKIVKEVKRISPNIKIAFSSIKKGQKRYEKRMFLKLMPGLKITGQKKLDYIKNTNIKEYLGVKKLHLNKQTLS